MITTHEERRAAARTVNNDPTLTDQSGAAETDLNVILKRYAQSGTIMSHGHEPMYMDWTELPHDYREYIEKAREIDALKARLPESLKHLPVETLMGLTNEQVQHMLKPPVEPTDEPKAEPK